MKYNNNIKSELGMQLDIYYYNNLLEHILGLSFCLVNILFDFHCRFSFAYNKLQHFVLVSRFVHNTNTKKIYMQIKNLNLLIYTI